MAIEVPKDAKVYTTKYANFKGVDYTNDPSNVWYRRSPNGVNMLPALDGKPYKRNGWKVEVPADEFITLWNGSIADYDDTATYNTGDHCIYNAKYFKCNDDNVTGDFDETKWDLAIVEPRRVFYFELMGMNYMMIFNSYGLFYYVDGNLHKIDSYIALDDDDDEQSFALPPEHEKAFFFEGQGTAGFYFFAGDKMFMFDGQNALEVQPKIPIILIACEPDGAGTWNEDVNMLTRKRIVQYTCDGVADTFTVPNGYVVDDGVPQIEVKIRDSQTGEWTTDGVPTYTATDGVQVLFDSAPTVLVEGEDNLQITYIPDDGYTVTEQADCTTDEQMIYLRKTVSYYQTQYKIIRHGGTTYETETKTKTTWNPDTVEFVLQSPKALADGTYEHVGKYRINTGDPEVYVWHKFKNPSAWVDRTYNPYKGSISLTAKKEMYATEADYTGIDTQTGSWSNWTEYKLDNGKHLSSLPFTITGDIQKIYYRTRTREDIFTQGTVAKIEYTRFVRAATDEKAQDGINAFWSTTRAGIFGNGLINQVFLTASTFNEYKSRVWYSAATDPTYFPDTNYIEVGATDTAICGLLPVGDYLGIIKQGSGTSTSIYLAYPTSFDDETTYAVKQSVNGIGAVSNGAFNLLNDEPMFLSTEGVMAIEPQENDEKRIRNRSYYVNRLLGEEKNIESAFSFIFKNMYWLCVNNHCYVLDGSQKSSWENEKTNLQYECYYLDNIPAQCFAKYNGDLWFSDINGNMCRFKHNGEARQFVDDYKLDAEISATASGSPTDGEYEISSLEPVDYEPKVGDCIQDTINGTYYTVLTVGDTTVEVASGMPIYARWGTIADDDGSAHYQKNLQKKGSLVAMLPIDEDSGVGVTLIADEGETKEKIFFLGHVSANNYILPFHKYLKKKVKKYKRLQIICDNGEYNEGFGIDQIIKSYTVGNYAKR